MRKKIFIPIIILVLIIALACCFLHFQLPYEHTLNAVKLDAQGNEVGTVEIPVTGTARRSVFHLNRIIAEVAPFDGISGFDIDSAKYEKFIDEDFLHRTFSITDIGSKEDIMDAVSSDFEGYSPTSYTYYISISEDFDRWLIHVVVGDNEPVYYLASVSGKYTAQELRDFFGTRLP